MGKKQSRVDTLAAGARRAFYRATDFDPVPKTEVGDLVAAAQEVVKLVTGQTPSEEKALDKLAWAVRKIKNL